MNETVISWTKKTWNPVFGCSKVSEGCRYCYAETLALRYRHSTKPWTAANAVENVRLQEHKLREPYALKEPTMIFVNSMSDLFHERVPDSYIARVFAVMNDLPQHTFQVLTKRPERAWKWYGPWTENIWMGVSVELQKHVDRIELLRYAPAKVKFVSFEPLLGPIEGVHLRGIHWAIVGGESGAHLTPDSPRWLNMAWARALRDQCVRAGVAFFFKQDSGTRTELRPYLVEEDGSHTIWQQMPKHDEAPVQNRQYAQAPLL